MTNPRPSVYEEWKEPSILAMLGIVMAVIGFFALLSLLIYYVFHK